MKFKRGDLVHVTLRGIVTHSKIDNNTNKEQTIVYLPEVSENVYCGYDLSDDNEITSIEHE